MRTISANLRAAQGALKAKERKVTYAEISAYLQSRGLGYGVAAVGHWFTGRNDVPVDALRHLADILDTSIEELVRGDPAFVARPDSKMVLKIYENLSSERAAAVLALMKSMEDRDA